VKAWVARKAATPTARFTFERVEPPAALGLAGFGGLVVLDDHPVEEVGLLRQQAAGAKVDLLLRGGRLLPPIVFVLGLAIAFLLGPGVVVRRLALPRWLLPATGTRWRASSLLPAAAWRVAVVVPTPTPLRWRPGRPSRW
jgi:hypothetical protein